MNSIIKIAILGIVGVVAAQQFKGSRSEYSLYIGAGIAMILFGFGITQAGEVISRFRNLKSYLEGAEGYLGILMKVVGITYICEFAAAICKDGGFTAVADQIEILGKLSVMFAGLPILFAVIDLLHGFM